MSEIVDKKDEDGLLGYLDINDDIERLLPGPNEKERNESRLEQLMTGKKRPVSHIDHEAKAWAHTNVTLPLLIGALRGATLGGRAFRGAKAIDKSSKFRHPAGLQSKMRPAQKMAKEEVKETGKALKEAKKDAPKKLFERIMYTIDGHDSGKVFDHRIAKHNARDIDTAIDVLSKSPAGRPGDIIEEAAAKSGVKAGVGTAIGNKAGKALVDNSGKWDSQENLDYEGNPENPRDVDRYDKRLYMSLPSKLVHGLNGIIGQDNLDPEIWPMGLIDDVLANTNADAGLWDTDQLDTLSGKEKVRLLMDIKSGRYDKDYEGLSKLLLKNYLKLTEGTEDKN